MKSEKLKDHIIPFEIEIYGEIDEAPQELLDEFFDGFWEPDKCKILSSLVTNFKDNDSKNV